MSRGGRRSNVIVLRSRYTIVSCKSVEVFAMTAVNKASICQFVPVCSHNMASSVSQAQLRDCGNFIQTEPSLSVSGAAGNSRAPSKDFRAG